MAYFHFVNSLTARTLALSSDCDLSFIELPAALFTSNLDHFCLIVLDSAPAARCERGVHIVGSTPVLCSVSAVAAAETTPRLTFYSGYGSAALIFSFADSHSCIFSLAGTLTLTPSISMSFAPDASSNAFANMLSVSNV